MKYFLSPELTTIFYHLILLIFYHTGHRLGTLLMNRGQMCTQRNGDAALSCQIVTDNQLLAHNLELDIGVSLQQLKNVENQVEKINDLMSSSKVLHRKYIQRMIFYIFIYQ